jgi:hypothetical protein
MEPQHFEPPQFGDDFDPYGQLTFEFPSTTLHPDQFSPWAGFGQAISTPAPETYTNSGFPWAEEASFQQLQEPTCTQNVAQLALGGVSRAEWSPQPAIDDQLPSADLPNHFCVDGEVVSLEGPAHRSSFTSYSASVWEAHRPHIKGLYMDEFKSLEDTMNYMAQNHDFRPS